MQERIELLLMSYDLEDLLEKHDITEEYVLTWLVDNGMIDLKEYFEDGTNLDG